MDTSCATPTKIDYATEIMSLKAELTKLQKIITEAVKQIKSTIVSLPQQSTLSDHDMETNTAYPSAPHQPCQPVIDLNDLVADLNHEIATIVIETQVHFLQQNLKLHNHQMSSPVT